MSQPDIFFIVLDTHRVDRIGCYGSDQALTPNIDQFAGHSVLFKHAVSTAQWTIPSHASMFTGLYPTAHQVTQSNLRLGPDTPHIAEILNNGGYKTAGFCNNPLVGVLDNDFKRGFDQYFNYAGSFPNRPTFGNASFFQRLKQRFDNFMRRRVGLPIQNFISQSDSIFSLTLNPWLTPLWSKWLSFKGQNETSVKDVVRFVDDHDQSDADQPLFLFLNLMETHLPFYPPKRHVAKVNPKLAQNPAAADKMREWNYEAYRWSRPLPDGLTPLEKEVLNSYYDAEVHYQDEFLKDLLSLLAKRENTLTIIVGDHGDSLGEHDYFGHAFVAYEELLHVPLLVRFPNQAGAKAVDGAISTRRVFHTILSAAGMEDMGINTTSAVEIKALSLQEAAEGQDVEKGIVFSEAYPPLNFVKAMQDRQPELIDQFRCNKLRRAIVQNNHKLIQVDNEPDELFDLSEDQLELNSVLQADTKLTQQLNQALNRMVGTLENQRDNLLAGVPLELEQDPQLLQHLRGLGYID